MAATMPLNRILDDAHFVADNSDHVSVDMVAVEVAATSVWNRMNEKDYSTQAWSSHELHPKAKNEETVHFIFLMDLLNFSFWSERDAESRFAIDYKNRKWTGYWSLVAALQRAIDEGIPITSPDFWWVGTECTDELLKHVFRSATSEEIPLIQARFDCIREAGRVLHDVNIYVALSNRSN